MLVRVADTGAAQLGFADGSPAGAGQRPARARGRARRRGQAAAAGRPSGPVPRCARPRPTWTRSSGPTATTCWRVGAARVVRRRCGRGGEAAALAGWVPASALDALSASLAQVGGAVVPLPAPRGVQPPSLITGRPMRRSLSPLVETYGTVPYADLDPTLLAGRATC